MYLTGADTMTSGAWMSQDLAARTATAAAAHARIVLSKARGLRDARVSAQNGAPPADPQPRGRDDG